MKVRDGARQAAAGRDRHLHARRERRRRRQRRRRARRGRELRRRLAHRRPRRLTPPASRPRRGSTANTTAGAFTATATATGAVSGAVSFALHNLPGEPATITAGVGGDRVDRDRNALRDPRSRSPSPTATTTPSRASASRSPRPRRGASGRLPRRADARVTVDDRRQGSRVAPPFIANQHAGRLRRHRDRRPAHAGRVRARQPAAG